MPTDAPQELQPIEQLAERVQSLIQVLGTTREELQLALDENSRLTEEVKALRGRLEAAEEQHETQTRERESERDDIRDRVTKMLEQLDEVNP